MPWPALKTAKIVYSLRGQIEDQNADYDDYSEKSDNCLSMVKCKRNAMNTRANARNYVSGSATEFTPVLSCKAP